MVDGGTLACGQRRNLGADLSAMGAALALLVGGNAGLYTLLFGLFCIGLRSV